MRTPFWLMLATIAVAGCSDGTSPSTLALVPREGPSPGDAANIFRIVLEKATYTRSEAAQFGIRASVTNSSSDQDFFSNVGDGFNSALEQPTIIAATGTDAVIERLTSSAWERAGVGTLDEGSRFVVLGAGKSYQLHAGLMPAAPGTYRIRLDFFAQNNNSSATPFHDYSASFLVR